jgi:hypothetical protein
MECAPLATKIYNIGNDTSWDLYIYTDIDAGESVEAALT